MYGLDLNARVIYIGTFSKVLFPSLRLGYMVIPADLMDRFVAVRHAMDIFPPYLHQEVMADFILEGHFTRHIRKMRQVYRERRSVLYESLTEQFPPHRGFEVLGVEAGMHLAFTLPQGFNDREISARAANSRLWLWPLSTSYISSEPRNGFVMGFGSSLPAQIPRAVRLMHSVINSG
jgi:GntR family transcriptional regulator/MocR family aminotransferase